MSIQSIVKDAPPSATVDRKSVVVSDIQPVLDTGEAVLTALDLPDDSSGGTLAGTIAAIEAFISKLYELEGADIKLSKAAKEAVIDLTEQLTQKLNAISGQLNALNISDSKDQAAIAKFQEQSTALSQNYTTTQTAENKKIDQVRSYGENYDNTVNDISQATTKIDLCKALIDMGATYISNLVR